MPTLAGAVRDTALLSVLSRRGPTIHGNLTDEPALRHSPNGVAVLTFSVAVNGRRFDRATNRWVDTSPVFHSVVAFHGLADNAAASLTKETTDRHRRIRR
ncbi:MAG TPA: single-stranded DNA-binding protein [Pseudonocardiaceae bacterium]|nr:single-stranded DNA-binding protein [Pseudonocardiaceae bacterium]